MSFGIQVFDAGGSLVFDETFNTFKRIFYTSAVITADTVISNSQINTNTQIAIDADEGPLFIIPEVTLNRVAKTVTINGGGGNYSIQFRLYDYK